MTTREQAQWLLMLVAALAEAGDVYDAWHVVGSVLLPDEYRANHRFTPIADQAILALSRSGWYRRPDPNAILRAIDSLDAVPR